MGVGCIGWWGWDIYSPNLILQNKSLPPQLKLRRHIKPRTSKRKIILYLPIRHIVFQISETKQMDIFLHFFKLNNLGFYQITRASAQSIWDASSFVVASIYYFGLHFIVRITCSLQISIWKWTMYAHGSKSITFVKSQHVLILLSE